MSRILCVLFDHALNKDAHGLVIWRGDTTELRVMVCERCAGLLLKFVPKG